MFRLSLHLRSTLQNQKMLQSRALFSGLVRPSDGFLDDDHKEAYISVKSLKVEKKAFWSRHEAIRCERTARILENLQQNAIHSLNTLSSRSGEGEHNHLLLEWQPFDPNLSISSPGRSNLYGTQLQKVLVLLQGACHSSPWLRGWSIN